MVEKKIQTLCPNLFMKFYKHAIVEEEKYWEINEVIDLTNEYIAVVEDNLGTLRPVSHMIGYFLQMAKTISDNE